MKYTLGIALLLSLVIACSDDPNLSDTPVISEARVEADTLSQSDAASSFLIKFRVEDGDGDIGPPSNNNAPPNVFLIDEASGFQSESFRLPELSEQAAGKGVKADVTMQANFVRGDICCRYPDGSSGCFPSQMYPLDSIFYTIYLVDMAGNESNRQRIGPVYLRCD